jgi:ankyrin repeat protein
MPLKKEDAKQFILLAHFDLLNVRRMLEAEPELLHAFNKEQNEDALGAASHVGNRPIAEYLLSKGAPLTIFAAAMLGRIDAVRGMLDKNPALINGRGAHGYTVLYHAAISGKTELVELLLSRGGGPEPSTALHAAIYHHHKAVVEVLLAHGIDDFTVTNFKGQTPLQAAQTQELDDILGLLKSHDANRAEQ